MNIGTSRILGAALATATAVSVAVAPPAFAHRNPSPQPPISVVAAGLEGPFEVSAAFGRLIVTESGTGQVHAIDPKTGNKRTLVSGLGEGAPSGAVQIGHRTFIVTGEAGGPPEESAEAAPTLPYPGSSVLAAHHGRVHQHADLLAFELANNPDGQTQFGPDGAPLDALSNPFFVIAERHRFGSLLVADGGANAVLRVNRHGSVSAYFVPPTVNTGACEGRPNNDEKTVGCDSVPTGLAYGPRNTLYVSALTGEAPGEGRVYILNARTGRVLKTISGFTSPTGVAVRPDGTFYVSEVLHNAPTAEPGPGFDPAQIGRIVKVAADGSRSYAAVTMPTGVLWQRGKLYASAWSIAGFLGIEGAGQVVAVADSAFSTPRS